MSSAGVRFFLSLFKIGGTVVLVRTGARLGQKQQSSQMTGLSSPEPPRDPCRDLLGRERAAQSKLSRGGVKPSVLSERRLRGRWLDQWTVRGHMIGPNIKCGGLSGPGRVSRWAHSKYRSTSLTRKRTTLGPYSRTMPRLLWRSRGGAGVKRDTRDQAVRLRVCAPSSRLSAPRHTGIPRS